GFPAPAADRAGPAGLAAIYAAAHPDGRQPAGIGEGDADRLQLARVAHDMAQAMDAVALHEAHGAGVKIRPDGLRAVALRRAGQSLRHRVERILPGDPLERRDAL